LQGDPKLIQIAENRSIRGVQSKVGEAANLVPIGPPHFARLWRFGELRFDELGFDQIRLRLHH
jgi:hypothetical protein